MAYSKKTTALKGGADAIKVGAVVAVILPLIAGLAGQSISAEQIAAVGTACGVLSGLMRAAMNYIKNRKRI